MNLETVFVALIVSVVAPVVLALLTSWQGRQSKKQDWDRQDELAERAELAAQKRAAETADALRRANQEVAEKVEAVAVQAKRAQRETQNQLKDIHTLVNSDMTAAREEQLAQAKLLLLATERIVADQEARGLIVPEGDRDAIIVTKGRITELEAILADRRAQQKQMEADQSEREGESPTGG